MLQRTPSDLLQPRSRIATLAAQANACHLAACRAASESVRFATEAGTALIAAKKLVGHGGWLKWVKDNLTFTDRTARYYMQLATLPQADRKRVSDLSLRAAVKMLAERQPQPKVRRPSPNPLAAALVDACIQLEGADVVSHLHPSADGS
jgi:hypothetical protein